MQPSFLPVRHVASPSLPEITRFTPLPRFPQRSSGSPIGIARTHDPPPLSAIPLRGLKSPI